MNKNEESVKRYSSIADQLLDSLEKIVLQYSNDPSLKDLKDIMSLYKILITCDPEMAGRFNRPAGEESDKEKEAIEEIISKMSEKYRLEKAKKESI